MSNECVCFKYVIPRKQRTQHGKKKLCQHSNKKALKKMIVGCKYVNILFEFGLKTFVSFQISINE